MEDQDSPRHLGLVEVSSKSDPLRYEGVDFGLCSLLLVFALLHFRNGFPQGTPYLPVCMLVLIAVMSPFLHSLVRSSNSCRMILKSFSTISENSFSKCMEYGTLHILKVSFLFRALRDRCMPMISFVSSSCYCKFCKLFERVFGFSFFLLFANIVLYFFRVFLWL
jgi:hypothetical protein